MFGFVIFFLWNVSWFFQAFDLSNYAEQLGEGDPIALIVIAVICVLLCLGS